MQEDLITLITNYQNYYNSVKLKLSENLGQSILNTESIKSIIPEDFESISWTQYTPYFNDGESCEFGVYANEYGKYNGQEMQDIGIETPYKYTRVLADENEVKRNVELVNLYRITDWSGNPRHLNSKVGEYGYVDNKDENLHPSSSFCFILFSVINMIPSEILREVIGDHIEVTLHKDGTITTENYEHD